MVEVDLQKQLKRTWKREFLEEGLRTQKVVSQVQDVMKKNYSIVVRRRLPVPSINSIRDSFAVATIVGQKNFMLLKKSFNRN